MPAADDADAPDDDAPADADPADDNPDDPGDGDGTPLGGVGSLAGIAGIAIGLAAAGFAALAGTGIFDLQLVQDKNLAPTGTSASAMRFTAPHAAQVASIIER